MSSYSFIIPCKNSSTTILNCINSILQLDIPPHSPIEIIAIINNCEDNTEAILRNTPVTTIFDSGDSAGHARNAGAQIANNKWLVFIDSDVVLDKQWLINAVPYLELGFYSSFASIIKPKGFQNRTILNQYREQSSRRQTAGTYSHLSTSSAFFPVINTAACIYEKKIFLKIGGFDIDLKAHEDSDLSVRYFMNGNHICLLSDSISFVYWERGLIKFLIRSYKHGLEARSFHHKWPKSSQKILSNDLKCSFRLSYPSRFIGACCSTLFKLAYHSKNKLLKNNSQKKIVLNPKNLITPKIVYKGVVYYLPTDARIINKADSLIFVSLLSNEYWTLPSQLIFQYKGIIEIKSIPKDIKIDFLNFLQL